MEKQYLLGYDIGTSSVKAALVDIGSGKTVASAQYPDAEAPIIARRPGWAEQEPEMWWEELKQATRRVAAQVAGNLTDVKAIGISYQMHGLVCIDKQGKALRPSIIWCDGRAVPYGEQAFSDLGADQCLGHLLNSPGIETGLGESKRARYLRADRQDHAPWRFHSDETDGRGADHHQRTVGGDAVGLQGETTGTVPARLLRIP